MLSISTFADGRAIDYDCVSNGLQAYDSDNYYSLGKAEIDSILSSSSNYGYIDVSNAVTRCELIKFNGDLTEKGSTCVANTLQAFNCDIYYNLTADQIKTMLDIVEMAGHTDALNAARLCGAYNI